MLAAEALKSGWFLENAWLIPLIPAIAFAVIIGFGKRLPQHGSEVGLAAMGASFVLAVGATYQWIQRVRSVEGLEGEGAVSALVGRLPQVGEGGHTAPFVEPVVRSWTWWQSGGVKLTIGEHIDGLAIVLLLVVTFISLLVQLYSTEYVRGDRRYTHFFAALTLFSAGMLVMVSSESMVQFILGWEIMGLCSFLLIGHWWEEEANSRAALKAFFTVRVGDVGLLVGTAILYFGAKDYAEAHGSNGFSIRAISAWALSDGANSQALLWGSVALFIAAIGKSGQFPLHTWLPDAMAGPTPVSSLLHSSTMVVAGVFLVARLYPVFFVGLDILDTNINLIAVIGGITIIMAAALAFVQDDIKKVLAYSTVSQLGYMMMGLGVGAWTPAVFHIFTHAFFKCCLFLVAGSISHSASHHSFDMKKDMGGLRKIMPISFATWMVSTLALTGVPFFSGFFSKDEIIDNAGNNGYTVFFYVGLIGAAMTAAYMARATYLTFFGEPRGASAGIHHDDHVDVDAEVLVAAGAVVDGAAESLGISPGGGDHGDHDDGHHDDHEGPHESPWRITVPLVILAVGAFGAGYLNAPAVGTEYFTEWVEPSSAVVAAGHGEFVEVEADVGVSGLVRAAPDGEEGTPGGAAEEGGGEGEHGATGCGFEPPGEGTCFAPTLTHAEFKWINALPSILLVVFGAAFSWWLSMGVYGDRKNPLKGLTKRNKLAGAGHRFLVNKYYLDDLYEKVIVHGVAHPIAKAAYWVNQNILDGVVNGAGRGGKRTGEWVYRNIDQRVVDGAVNASGLAASESGHALQPIQSGKVNQYGALLFGAATVGAIVLILINV